MAHEHAHIKQLHSIDLMVCEVFTVMHFFNPFMWLLRRDLKLIHEYQADQAVLNKGIDAQKYQLLVLQRSVGEKRFAMANHFTQKPILKRLKMMQQKNKKQWAALKLILFVPLLILLLQAFARPEILIEKASDFIPSIIQKDSSKIWLNNWTIENLQNINGGIITEEYEVKPPPPGYPESNLPKYDKDKHGVQIPMANILSILINKNNMILSANTKVDLDELLSGVENFLKGNPPFKEIKKGPELVEKNLPLVGNIKVSRGVITIRYDVDTKKKFIQNLLRSVGEKHLEARQDVSSEHFKQDYFSLTPEKKNVVNQIVPIRVSIMPPKTIKPPPPPPPRTATLKQDCELSIPEGFSPNNDGVHDYFKIECIYPQYPNAKLMIFNSQGQKLFEKENYGNPDVWGNENVWWEGTSENSSSLDKDGRLKAGNYVYVLELGNGEKKNGTILLAKSSPPHVLQVLPKNPQYQIPSIRFHEKWININGERCEISRMNDVLEELLPTYGTQRQVELTVYSTVSEERVKNIYTELENLDDLEIVRKDITPPPPPPLKPITLKKNGTVNFGGKDYSFEEFEKRITAIETQHRMISNKNDVESYRLHAKVIIEEGTHDSHILRFKEIMKAGNFVDIIYSTITPKQTDFFSIEKNGKVVPGKNTKLSRAEKKEQKEKESILKAAKIKNILESRQWVLEEDFSKDRHNGFGFITPTSNFVCISGENVTIQKGRTGETGINGVGGVTLDGKIYKYELIEGKKPGSGFSVILMINGSAVRNSIIQFNINPNGNATATVSGLSIHGGILTYHGKLFALDESIVYKGSTIF